MTKDESIRLMNSITNSVNLAVGKPDVFKVDSKEDLVEIIKFLYSIKVTDFGNTQEQEILDMISKVTSLTDLNALKPDVLKTGNKNIFKEFNDKLKEYATE